MDQIKERLIRIENIIKYKDSQGKGCSVRWWTELHKQRTSWNERKAGREGLDTEREVEDLRNRSRRNNLVFYNITEKVDGQDWVAFIKGFIAMHMGLETLCGNAEIEMAHRTPIKVPGNNNKKY